MSDPLFYREIQFSRLRAALPEKAGSFVADIPTEAVEEYRKEHPTDTIDRTFRNLISRKEIDRMKDSLKLSDTSEDVLVPFAGDLQSLGTPTLEGEKGRKFWTILAKSLLSEVIRRLLRPFRPYQWDSRNALEI